MFFAQKILLAIKVWRTAKRLKAHNVQVRSNLTLFAPIETGGDLDTHLALLRGNNRYAPLVNDTAVLAGEVARHNDKVLALESRFDALLTDESIECILEHASEYDQARLGAIQDTLQAIEGFHIPDGWRHKGAFLDYSVRFRALQGDWQAVCEQHELVERFRAILRSTETDGEGEGAQEGKQEDGGEGTGDDEDAGAQESIGGGAHTGGFADQYVDDRMAAMYLAPAREVATRFASYTVAHYPAPSVEAVEEAINQRNERYIRRHLADEIFDDVSGRSLDENQRRAVLCDALSSLTVAGAGAGKTLTICGKLMWLFHTKQATPDDVLLLSYSKASATDLASKVDKLNVPYFRKPKVKTFHALGLEILTKAHGQKLTIDEQFAAHIKNFFTDEVQRSPRASSAVFTFYALYSSPASSLKKKYANKGEEFSDLKRDDFTTLKDRLRSLNKDKTGGKKETLQKELVKSYEELVIANWFFVNGVKYEYERSYEVTTATSQKRQYTPDFYLSDYAIYLEHYGINKEGKTPQYTADEEQAYLDAMKWKRQVHQENGTVCLETYSWQFEDGTIFDALKAQLEKHGVTLKPLTQDDILNALSDIYSGVGFRSLMNLLVTFLSLYKAQFADAAGFDTLHPAFPTRYENERAARFLDVARCAYEYYERQLHEQGKIDFDDMILRSVSALDATEEYRYKYIIVDEFQDISESRSRFLEKLIEHGRSKLFAVGDDWQAIYRFTGCDVGIFLNFAARFKGARLNFVPATHRNSSELQAVVEPFILANPAQIKKHVLSKKHQVNPARIIYHDDDRRAAFRWAADEIAAVDEKASVLVLGRNRRDVIPVLSDEEGGVRRKGEALIDTRHPAMSLSYKTVHQSKGLEATFVVLLSGEEGENGFPNKMEDDRILELLLGQKEAFPFAEERRLFYVALTRTRSVVYVLSDKNRPSSFVKEIENRCHVTDLSAQRQTPDTWGERTCPWCKGGQLKERAGLTRFWGCSNYPYCKYTINDSAAVKANERCPDCGDFLVERTGKWGAFLGCHAFPACRFTRDKDKG